MRAMASPARQHTRPARLMDRLAIVANEQQAAHLPVPIVGTKRAVPARARYSTLVSFGLGALTSSVIGGVAFLGLQALAAGEARTGVDRPAAAAMAAPAKRAPYVFDVAIDRSEGAHAPFGMQLRGTEDDSMEVVLQGIPATVRLDRGRRRGAGTWVVKRAELDDLHLALGDAAPDAFDVRIDVLAPPPGMAAVGSVMRVRLVGSASSAKIAAGGEHSPGHQAKSAAPAGPGLAAALAPAAAVTSDAARRRQVARAPARPAAAAGTDADVAAVKSAPQARSWPERASGLGAVARDSERQVWWTMPPPSWSPFRPDGTP